MERTLPLNGKYCQDEGENKQDKRFPFNINTQVKSQRMGKTYHTNTNQPKTRMAIMITYIQSILKTGVLSDTEGELL